MPAPHPDFHDDDEIVRLKRPGAETPKLQRMWDLLRDGDTYADARSKRWRGRPPHTRVLDLERKLCCTGCGNRRGNTLTVSMAPRN